MADEVKNETKIYELYNMALLADNPNSNNITTPCSNNWLDLFQHPSFTGDNFKQWPFTENLGTVTECSPYGLYIEELPTFLQNYVYRLYDLCV